MRSLFFFLLILADLSCSATCSENDHNCPWLILYSGLDSAEIEKYNPLLLDPTLHPPIDPLKNKKIALFAKVDVSAAISAQGEQERLQKLSDVMDKQIPVLLNEGFTGIFLTGLVSAKKTIMSHPVATEIVMMCRMHFPLLPIFVHNGSYLISETAQLIQGIVESSVTTSYDAENKQYFFIADKEHKQRVSSLQKVKKLYPSLQVFTLDTWDPKDIATIKKIYALEKGYGFRPYVAGDGFKTIVEAP